MAKQINARIINKSGFESEWINAATFIPKNAELIIYRAEIDQKGNLITLEDGKTASLPEGRTEFYSYARFKIGDGVTPVNDLPFEMKNYATTEYVLQVKEEILNSFIDASEVAM